MTSANKKRLTSLVRRFVLERGGAANDDGTLVIETTAGVLGITPMGDWIAGRFLDVDRAKRVLPHGNLDRLNAFSGKWNFHFGTESSPFACFHRFKTELQSLLTTEESNAARGTFG